MNMSDLTWQPITAFRGVNRVNYVPTPECAEYAQRFIDKAYTEASAIPFAGNLIFLAIIYFMWGTKHQKHIKKVLLIALAYNLFNIVQLSW